MVFAIDVRNCTNLNLGSLQHDKFPSSLLNKALLPFSSHFDNPIPLHSCNPWMHLNLKVVESHENGIPNAMIDSQFRMLGLLKPTETESSFGVFAPGIDLTKQNFNKLPSPEFVSTSHFFTPSPIACVNFFKEVLPYDERTGHLSQGCVI